MTTDLDRVCAVLALEHRVLDPAMALEIIALGAQNQTRALDRLISEVSETDLLEALAKELGVDMAELRKRAELLAENNPMLGHRGVRLGITYPEITTMQVRAIQSTNAVFSSLLFLMMCLYHLFMSSCSEYGGLLIG